jgi:predicted nucleic acid-binding protein
VAAGLLDTNVVILLARFTDDTDLPDPAFISTVTLGELSVGPLVTADPEVRLQRVGMVQLVESELTTLPFDDAVARVFGRVGASLHAAGRKVSARGFDAMIAATAMAHGLPLYTCNPQDFDGIDELDVIAVPHPGR